MIGKDFEFLIKHTPAAVAMFNEKVEYIAYSDRWLKDYNLVGQDLHGRSHYEVFPDLLEKWKKDHQHVLEGNIWKSEEEEWFRDDGSPVYIRAELRPWRDSKNDIKGLIMFTEVITESVLVRKELEKTNLALNSSNYELIKKNKELEEFAYIASHDLQEPLRTIKSYSDFLLSDYYENFDQVGKKSLSFMSEASNRMSKLIRGILDYSKIGIDQVPIQVDCENILHKVVISLESSIKKNNAVVEYVSMPTITCYPLELELLFQNLISNAIKYQNHKETPIVKVAFEEKETEWKFMVKDNGIGIEKKHQERIFKLFQRLHSREEFSGMGIGLSHCKKIVDLHKGDIGVFSHKNEGSTFYFTITKNLS